MHEVMRSVSPNHSAVASRRPLAMLNWLGLALFIAAVVMLCSAVLAPSGLGLALMGLALVIASLTCWRLARVIDIRLDEAQADGPEVLVGDPSRVFAVDQAGQPDGGRLVLLREVTRERQALQAKDELLAIVSHELRTPLSSIKGYGQLMARQLATVQDQVQRLDHLISDVLDTARADAGRLTVRREPLSLSAVVTAAAERFRAANPDRRLT